MSSLWSAIFEADAEGFLLPGAVLVALLPVVGRGDALHILEGQHDLVVLHLLRGVDHVPKLRAAGGFDDDAVPFLYLKLARAEKIRLPALAKPDADYGFH